MNQIQPELPNMPHVRPSWDEYYSELARVMGTRSTCDRGRIGAVIVKDKRLLTGGYAGSPPGMPHCDEVGHLMKKTTHEDGSESMHCLRTVHSEMNAILQAARFGIPIDGATMYCKFTPCRTCAMSIMSAGIVRVVCLTRYHAGRESEDMFAQAGVALKFMTNGKEEYANQK